MRAGTTASNLIVEGSTVETLPNDRDAGFRLYLFFLVLGVSSFMPKIHYEIAASG
jgi:hypothetical protein